MASNKKAQILAAVMCASSIFGSYTVVSAADSISAGNINQTGAQVSTNENGKITATAKNDNGKSTITLQGNNFSVSVGGTATSSLALKDGTFTLNSKNLKIDSNGLNIYDGTNTSPTAKISKAGAITGTGLTIKNGTTTLASLNNSGLTVNGTSNINSTGTNANSGKSAKSTVSYSSGVQDTVTNDTLKGYTTTAQVLYSGVNNKVVDNNTNNILAQTSVGLVDRPQDNSKYGNIVLTANKYVVDTTEAVTKKVSTTILTLDGNTAKLEAGVGGSNNANVNLNSDKKGTVAITAGKVEDVQGNITLSGKNVNLDRNGLTLYKDNAEGTKTSYAILNSSGLSINNNANFDKFGTNSYNTTFKATNSEQSYNLEKWTAGNLENKVSSKLDTSGLTTTVQSKGNDAGIENTNSTKNKTTSQVSATGVRDTVYDDGGQIKATSSVTIGGIANTVNNSSITNTVNDVNTGKPLADSRLTTSGISNTTTALQMTGTNAGNTMSTGIYQNNGGISATATKKDVDGNTIGISTLSLGGNSASLKVGNYGFAVDSNNNVSIAGNNATLSGSTFTLKDANGKTATLNTSGLTLKDEDGNTTGGISTTGAITGTSLNITAKNTAGNKTTSTVGATGVTDAVYGTDGARVAYSNVGTGGISNTTSLKTTTGKIDTAINQNTSGVGINSTKYDTNNNVTDKTSLTMNGSANNITSIKYNDSNKTAETTSVSVNGGTSSITSYGNYVYGEDGKATSYNQASMSLNGNTGTATIRGGSNTASSTLTLNEAGVALSGKNASLSGSTFTLKDTTNGKTLASLGASGLSINNADGIKVGGISNTGNLIANDGMNVTDKNSSWVNIGTSTMQKDITATTTTSYAGITNKIDTTLAGNKTYTSGTVVGPTSVTTTVQGSTTTDAISGNKNKTTSTVSATGVTDTVYNVKGNQVASSSVTTNGIVNTTTNLSIDGSTNNTMSTSIYQDKRGISASATKKDENGTVGTSTLTLAGNSASLKVGNYGFAVDSNNNVSIAGNNATLSGSTFTLKDANGKTATLNTSGLTLKDEDGNTTGGISTTGAITGTSLNITAKNTAGNKTTSTVGATGVTDAVYGTDGARVAYSNVGTGGISNTTSLKTTTGKIDTAINQNTSGVGITSTKYNDSNKTTETTSVSVNGGTSSITSNGSYVYGEDGKVTSYNQASMSLNGNTGTATIRGGSNTASSTLTLNEAGVALSGKNANLSGSTFTLKDTASGKSIATLGTNGLSLNKVNSDGTTINYGTWNSNGLNVNGTGTTTIKSTNATTGAMGQSQLSYNGVTDTVTNAAGNKTTSTVNATGVTDTVYNVKGNQVASSSVGTSGISNTTTALQMTGTNAGNTMSTGIYQNNGGISATATKKDVDGNTIGTSTLSLGGNSASLKVGNYGFAVDSSNNVSISGNNATLSGSTFTLKDVNTGKTAILNTNGLTLKDGDGTITGGISTTGAVTGTSLRITTSEDAGGNKTVSTVATNAVTDTVTNTKTNNKTTSQVSATGVRDTVYDANNKTVASSTVTTSGISNNTNISGIAIKDDKYNTKTMNTSIAQNANGVSISSTKYNVYNDGTNTVQTTDGTSSISVNGAKTTISGYGNYEYEKDENGKLVVSSRNSASLSVDGESGIISLSGKNVGLSANGLTLYKDVEGVKTQYASLTAGGLNVNGTGTTTIKSTNATTGAMGQSQLSYNGVTDTVTNAAGNKTTSTVNATGTIDQVYDTDGKTRIAYSNITTTGITDSFTKDGITNSVTTNANGTTFASTGNGSTTIKGGAITTNSITVAGNTIDGGFFDTIGQTNGNTAGIVRTEINGDWITSIEGALDISRSGNISLNADKLTYSYNDGKNSGTLGALANKVDDIYDRTQGIDYDKATGTTTIDGNLSVKDETTTGDTGSTGETGTTPTNGNITANTANIGGVQIGKNAVTATTGNFDNVVIGGTEGTSISKDGVTVGDKKSDNYTSITNNDVVVNNNGNKTSLADVGNRVTGLESSVNSMNNRLSDVEDRIDKVGAMSAAIANLRTMGYDPEAPTEIAVGIGQYKSETGLALGIFHYPNQDFMLSASISTSGDEVMGGIGATWKLGRKSAAEKAKDEEARRLEKAEEMKKLAQDAKVKAQAERHAKLLAEREAQKTA